MAAQQPSLSNEFEELWPEFEGQRVSKVIMTFAGEVDLSADPDLCHALAYLGDAEFTIIGRVTGKKFSLKGNNTVGNATLSIDRIRAGTTTITTKVGKRAEEATVIAGAEPETPTPIRRGRRKKDPVWDAVDAAKAEEAEAAQHAIDEASAADEARARDDAAWEAAGADPGEE